MNRREFLLLAGAAAAGCQAPNPGSQTPQTSQGKRVVDAGPSGRYATEGIYDSFRDQGFFLVRREGKLFALSSLCTHRNCKLKGEQDHTFYCPCHGSTFDPSGHVTEGPAKRDLPVFATEVNSAGHLLVTVMQG